MPLSPLACNASARLPDDSLRVIDHLLGVLQDRRRTPIICVPSAHAIKMQPQQHIKQNENANDGRIKALAASNTNLSLSHTVLIYIRHKSSSSSVIIFWLQNNVVNDSSLRNQIQQSA